MLGGDGGGRMGGANCRLVRRVARLVEMAVVEQAAEHGPRVSWASMLLCACWKATHLFFVAADLFVRSDPIRYDMIRYDTSA